jgi:hypothetical protein
MRSLGLLVCVLAAACTAQEPAPAAPVAGEPVAAARARCSEHDPLRRAFFGELHVHTSFSMDAQMFGTRSGPHDAYLFARGEAIEPMTAFPGRPAMPLRLERPLDFAAVTDHAENFGAVALCLSEGSPAYESASCRTYRGDGPIDRLGVFEEVVLQVTRRQGAATAAEVCGEDRERCLAAATGPWQATLDAAQRFQDTTSACSFTTFPAYEFSYTPELSKVHRNVIFRNDRVLPLPISADDVSGPAELWQRLKAECLEAGTGCDVLAIPHNPNLSDGRMFFVELAGDDTPEARAELARLRAEIEPVVEMMQIKGDSECRNDLWGVVGPRDELCDFEKMRAFSQTVPDCEGATGAGALVGRGCVSKLDFVRYALVAGLQEAERIGANPYEFGFIAATDGHDATPGDVEERVYDGRQRHPIQLSGSPGGLAGVWAEENSRDSIFDSLERREVFGTSGPRIRPRFFAGWELPEDLCERRDFVEQGYAHGVPMGGLLPARSEPGPQAPGFAVWAAADPGTHTHPGMDLERIQLVKAWSGPDGQAHQQVYDLAFGGDGDASVDPETCETRGRGARELCAVFRDPDFDPARSAVYYARAVENPTCRYSVRQCAARPEGERSAACDDPRIPKTVQERAWTSPIWYAGAASR